MSYTHTTIKQWPGNISITDQIHEAIWEWQQKANDPDRQRFRHGEEALIDEAAAIFAIIGTRMAPAMVAERISRTGPVVI